MPRNTLQILRTRVVVLWAADAILLISSLAGTGIQRAGLQTVARDAAPSVIAAQRIKTALAAMDAEALRALLTQTKDDSVAISHYEIRRQEAASALLGAAENITFGESEREPIRKLQLGLGTYEARFARARYLFERRDPAYLAAYREAVGVMNQTLLPATEALDTANLRPLESAYEAQQTRSMFTRAGVILAALLMLFLLLATQIFLTRRTNRTLNLPLVAATLFTFAWSGWIVSTLSLEQADLRVAKSNAFTSLHALWQAKAVAQQALGDEFRFLIDKQRAAPETVLFQKHVDELLRLPKDVRIDQIGAAARGPGKVLNFNGMQDASGLLVDELRNITFDGERDAAMQSVLRLGEYLRIDQDVHELEGSGKHADAVAVATGSREGDANWAMRQFDRSLDAAIAINQNEFDRAVADGFAALQYFDWKTCGIAFLIAILSLLGLLQRIAEYR